jgi:hypothetical protein
LQELLTRQIPNYTRDIGYYFFIKAGRQQLSKLASFASFDNSFYITARNIDTGNNLKSGKEKDGKNK